VHLPTRIIPQMSAWRLGYRILRGADAYRRNELSRWRDGRCVVGCPRAWLAV
jgi:hypothetical protein